VAPKATFFFIILKKTFRILHPYSLEKNYFLAIDEEMNRLQPHEWGCIMDIDTMPLQPNFGHQLQEYIYKYPDTGLFTCYASRCHYTVQVRKGTNMMNSDILYHKRHSDACAKELNLTVKEIDRKIAGHLMMIKKSTWDLIRADVKKQCSSKKILGVDTKISLEILKHGLKIRLMRGIYIFHYLRLDTNFGYKNHLL